MKKFTRLAANILTLTLFALPASAEAASISNLDSKPRTIGVYDGNTVTQVTIDGYGVYQVPGALKVRVNDRDSYIEYNEEYALWKNGDFGPQAMSPNKPGGSRF